MSALQMSDNIYQKVISDNTEIFNTICEELQKAQSEILIASAWFTDDALFQILLAKAQTIKVDIIIGENQDNTKLDFDQLVQKGATCLRIRNVGYGIMHQKFCVIDRKLAIHGSYNYTNNARLNNHESVIATNHEPTVNSLIETFFSIKQKAAEKAGDMEAMDTAIEQTKSNFIDAPKKQSYQVEFEEVLSTLIEAEINQFSRKDLKEMGFSRSEACNGDHNILPNALDTVYFNFINDINITEDKKQILLTKISELRISKLQALEVEHSRNLNTHKIEFETKKANADRAIEEKKTSIQIYERKIEGIKNNDITNLQRLISQLKEKINEAKREFIRPKHKLFDLVPLTIMNSVLFIYLVLFYSSAAYILLFSVTDTMIAMKSGAEIPPHQVFEPRAISLALTHGGSSIFFIILFVFIPICFALADRYVPTKFWKIFISYGLGIFLVDGLLAYTVSKSIYDIKVLTEGIREPWSASYAFTDVNFYLVFLMGAAALLVFKFTFSKLISLFEARSADLNAQKNALLISQYEDQVEDHNKSIFALSKEIEIIDLSILNEKKEKEQLQQNLNNMPILEAVEQSKILSEHDLKGQYYNHICNLYNNKVENNNPRISIDALRDRINVFLEGWNDFLHKFYSVFIATEKSSFATDITSNWLSSKLMSDKIDSRVNA